MEKRETQITILNLSGELSRELRNYFESRKIRVHDPLEGMEEFEWTHIIIKDVLDYKLINNTYNVCEKNIHLVSLSKVCDLKDFTAHNGNLVYDEIWSGGTLGDFILDKYFQSYGGSDFSDNYPAFTELGSFNVVNPFSTGEYLDRLVQAAYQKEIDALPVKTYFDHLLMYAVGLKNDGKAGLPFEVLYGAYEDIFAVQLHFFSEKLNLQDVQKSLSSTLSKKAEEYYLNIAVQSADFFDLSFMSEVKKIVITSLWTKDKRIKFENRGLMLCSLENSLPLKYSEEIAPGILMTTEEPSDFSQKVFGVDEEQPSSETISAGQDPEEGVTTVKGGEAEDVITEIIKGLAAQPDEIKIIKGESELEQLVQTVKGKYDEEDKTVFRISGGKLDVDKVAFRIASNVDKSAKDTSMKVRSLEEGLPQSIKTGLFDFAKGLKKPVEELTEEEVSKFQLESMPEILKKELLKSIKDGLPPQVTAPAKQSDAKLIAENERLKTQLKTLTSEVRILKDARKKLAEIQMKASEFAPEPSSVSVSKDTDEQVRKEIHQKLKDQKILSEQDSKKLSALLEKENKLAGDLKQAEITARKLELEARQKDAYLAQEIEKAERQSKAKDLIVIKTKDSFTKLIEKKDKEIFDLKIKSDQMTKALNSGPSLNHVQQIRDLEKNNQNLIKQLDMMKAKIASLATNMQPNKSEEALKEESRKLHMLNQQMKNQIDLGKKEIEKLQTKLNSDSAEMANLKQDKIKYDQLLKKATLDEKSHSGISPRELQQEQELKKLMSQNQTLDNLQKESSQKIAMLEAKLLEATKVQKTVATVSGDDSKKAIQLEGTVKKLTQDLVNARNEMAEAKKEINKVRQEKTALQNQLDKLKKEADKSKPAAPKKPGGKAA